MSHWPEARQEKKRSVFDYQIPRTLWQGKEQPPTVSATETCTAGIILQQREILTHSETGAIICYVSDEEHGRYLAGILGALGIDWTLDAEQVCDQVARLDDEALYIFRAVMQQQKPNEQYRRKVRERESALSQALKKNSPD